MSEGLVVEVIEPVIDAGCMAAIISASLTIGALDCVVSVLHQSL